MNSQRSRLPCIRIVLSMLWLGAILYRATPALAQSAPAPSVIVVGAGMAGLAAAQQLHASGFAVTVLEARSRVGGRMHTDTNATGTTLDLGAGWIHGYQPQLEALVARMNLVHKNSDFNAMRFYSASHQQIDVTEQMRNDLAALLGNAASENTTSFPDRSIQTMLDNLWSSDSFQGYPRDFIDFFTTAAFDTEFASTASKIPTRVFSEPGRPPEDLQLLEAVSGPGTSHNTAFPEGFNQVTDRLKVGLEIRLNTEVTRIDYADGQPLVTVTTKGGEQHVANHVVVTVPIGVLKAGTITFDPPLPAEKLGAIQRIGSGLLNKVFLEFRPQDQFWPRGPSSPDVLGTSSSQRGAFSVWIDMQKITGKPILMAWTSGDSARAIEGLDDEKTKRAALSRLREAFPGRVPEPISVKVTRWSRDPYARGSYSTFDQATQVGDRVLLGEPVANNRVLFAGEATVDSAFAQVTGAYASGIREANRVIAGY